MDELTAKIEGEDAVQRKEAIPAEPEEKKETPAATETPEEVKEQRKI